MNTKDSLQVIGNTLLVNAGRVNKPGLMNGKTGVIILLYHLHRLTKMEHYKLLAEDMLEEIFSKLQNSSSISFDFEEGLTGIGWGIGYILNNEFAMGDPNEILENVDELVKENLVKSTIVDPCENYISQAYYLLARNKADIIKIQPIANSLPGLLNQTIIKLQITGNMPGNGRYLSMSLQIVLFLIEHHYKIEIINSILTNIIDTIKNYLDSNNTNSGDLLIIKSLLKIIIRKDKNYSTGQINHRIDSYISQNTFKIQDYINYTWGKILFNTSAENIDWHIDINKAINESMVLPGIERFSARKGLTGIGLGLINMQDK